MQKSSSTGGWATDTTNLDLRSMVTPRWRLHDSSRLKRHKHVVTYSKQKTKSQKQTPFFPPSDFTLVCGTSMTRTVDGSEIQGSPVDMVNIPLLSIIYIILYIPGGDRRISEPSTVYVCPISSVQSLASLCPNLELGELCPGGLEETSQTIHQLGGSPGVNG